MRGLTIAAAVLVLAAGEGGAQSGCTTRYRFIAGGHMSTISLKASQDPDPSSGLGAGLILGYGFTPRLGIFITATRGVLDREPATVIKKPVIEHYDLGLVYRFVSCESVVVPFLVVALNDPYITTTVTITDSSGITRKGKQYVTSTIGLPAIGAGVDIHMSPRWASSVGFLYYRGRINERWVGDKEVAMTTPYNASGFRVDLGFKAFLRPAGQRKQK